MRVLLAGGGSAGHTSPLLATADALRRIDPAVEITCLGTREGLEARLGGELRAVAADHDEVDALGGEGRGRRAERREVLACGVGGDAQHVGAVA